MIALELVERVEGEMALVAGGAVVIRALDRDRAGAGQPGLRSVADEAGVVLAVGTDDAGALIPLFLPAWIPA